MRPATAAMVLLLVSLPFPFAVAAGDTLVVPDDYPTIQAAITAAAPSGDTVLVRSGTYSESLVISEKDIILTSESGPETTIIDALGGGVGISLWESASVVDGFTIENGDDVYGGGINVSAESAPAPSPVITNNIIQECTAQKHGGGIYSEGCAPLITGNTIQGNLAKENGGGVYCKNSALTITGNTITDNLAGKHGAGIYCKLSDPTIEENTITYNAGTIWWVTGGGIECSGSGGTIRNNVIAGNTSGSNGGGIACVDGSSTSIEGNLIGESGSIPGNLGDKGGGVYCAPESSSTVTGNQIIGNLATSGGGVYLQGNPDGSGSSLSADTIAHNQAQAGGGVFLSGFAPLVEDCDIHSNVATDGGGIYMSRATSAVVKGCEIHEHMVPGDGGGVYIDHSSAALDEGCLIADNTAENGGGVLASFSTVSIGQGSTVRDNVASENGGGVSFATEDDLLLIVAMRVTGNIARNGGGLWVSGGFFKADSVVVDGNYASLNGGGVRCVEQTDIGTDLNLELMTVAKNQAQSGGGLNADNASTGQITNSIFWDNVAENTPDLIVPPGPVYVSYCDVQIGLCGADHNICEDPLFLNADCEEPCRDFRLSCESPCIDAGNPDYQASEDLDFEGDDRVVDGDSVGGPQVDMGADEFDMLWVFNGPATEGGSPVNFTAMAPPAQIGNTAYVLVSLGDGSDSGGIPVEDTGEYLMLDADPAFRRWRARPPSIRRVLLGTCPPGSSTAAFPIPAGIRAGLTVYYAGISVTAEGVLVSVTPTHSLVTK